MNTAASPGPALPVRFLLAPLLAFLLASCAVSKGGNPAARGLPNGAAALTEMSGGFQSPLSTMSEWWDIGTGVTGFAWKAEHPRAVVLLQHGYMEYAQRFETQYNELIPRLLEAGISVYAFDMRGHGRSPGKRGVTDLNQAVKDHLAARRKLAALGLPVFVLGHSIGGLVTATSVAEQPEGVAGMILSAPALLYAGDNFVNRTLLKIGAFIAPGMRVSKPVSTYAGLYHGAGLDEELPRDPLLYRGGMRLVTPSTALSLAHRNWKRYASIKVPTLALHGTDDGATNPEGSKRLIETIASTDKQLLLVEEGYHELLNDTRQDAVLHSILGWLDAHVAPATEQLALRGK